MRVGIAKVRIAVVRTRPDIGAAYGEDSAACAVQKYDAERGRAEANRICREKLGKVVCYRVCDRIREFYQGFYAVRPKEDRLYICSASRNSIARYLLRAAEPPLAKRPGIPADVQSAYTEQ